MLENKLYWYWGISEIATVVFLIQGISNGVQFMEPRRLHKLVDSQSDEKYRNPYYTDNGEHSYDGIYAIIECTMPYEIPAAAFSKMVRCDEDEC